MQDRIEALLAQVGFWAGRWVGQTQSQFQWVKFKLYIDFRKGTGYTETQIARELNISTTELRAAYYSRRIHTRGRDMLDQGYSRAEVYDALGITEYELGSNPN